MNPINQLKAPQSQWVPLWTLLLAAWLSLAAQAAPVPADQLPLSNPGFEEGATSWSIGERVTMSRVVPEAAHTGKQGLRVTDEDPKLGSSAFSSRMPVAPGQGFSLSFWGKSAKDGAAGVMLCFFDEQRRALPQYQPTMVLTGGGEWKQYRLLARAPETAATVTIWIHTFSTPQTSIDLDDFQLSRASGPEIEALAVPAVSPMGAPVRVRTKPANIVLKLDDLVHVKGKVPERWKKVADYIRGRGIKASFGIICNSLEGDNPEYFDWIKGQQASGLIEFWNHGYTHREWQENGQTVQEFKGPSYEAQLKALTESEQLARQKLGFPLTAFGAPFNATDENTLKALPEIPDLKVWMYGDPQNPAGKVVLDRVGEVNIENPLFLPSLDRFVRGFNNYPDRDYFVIQGHPAQWDDARFEQFTKIIDFLTEQKAIFTTPTEYARLQGIPKPLAKTAPIAAPLSPIGQPVAATVAAYPASLVANADFSAPLPGSWTASGRMAEAPRLVDASIDGAATTRALELSPEYREGGQPWDSSFSAARIAVPVAKGDTLLVQFWGRATPTSRVNVVFQQATAPFEKSIRETAALRPQWQKFTFYAPAKAAYPAGGANFELQLGLAAGKVQLADLKVLNLGPIGTSEVRARYGTQSIDYFGGQDTNDDWLPAAQARIEKNRKADLKLRVVDAAGKPVAGAQVSIRQTKSAFRWGTAVGPPLLAEGPDGDKYRETLLRLFNTAVLENDLKWKATDSNPVAQKRAQDSLNWLGEHGLAVRGHTMVWGGPRYLPDRLNNLGPDELRSEVTKRVADAVASTRGKVYVWDVVNEAGVNTQLWDKIGWDYFSGVYKQAHQLAPEMLLSYNDYNIANEAPDRGALRLKVEERIKTLLDAGAPVDILGDQAHMGVPLTPIPRVLSIWEDWGQKFGKPLEITEFDTNVADDTVHAKYVRDFLTAAFSDPNIESFLIWGFWAKTHFLGESGALYRADWSPRPAALVFEDLILHQWRTNTTLNTDRTGATATRAFLGDYEIQITSGGRTQTVKLSVDKKGLTRDIRFPA